MKILSNVIPAIAVLLCSVMVLAEPPARPDSAANASAVVSPDTQAAQADAPAVAPHAGRGWMQGPRNGQGQGRNFAHGPRGGQRGGEYGMHRGWERSQGRDFAQGPRFGQGRGFGLHRGWERSRGFRGGPGRGLRPMGRMERLGSV